MPFIKPGLQMRYLSMVILSIIFVSILFAILFYFDVVRTIAYQQGYLELKDQLIRANIRMFLIVMGYGIVASFFTLIISHKFAGPLYQYEKTFKKLTEGDLRHKVSIRKDDELGEMQDLINQMTESFKVKIKKDREHIKKITKALTQIINKSQRPKTDKKSVASDLVRIKKTISSITEEFTIWIKDAVSW